MQINQQQYQCLSQQKQNRHHTPHLSTKRCQNMKFITNVSSKCLYNLNRQMKTTNQFDYPTASATTYKGYRQEPNKNESRQDKQNYKEFIKQQSEQERNRVKLEEQRRKQKQSKEEQKKLKEQLEKKRKELDQLQRKREEAMREALLAAEQAKIKEENDRKKKAQNELKAKYNQQNAQFRFKDALRRLQNQREQNAIQERQAQQRRKAQNQAEKVQRKQAIKFKQYLQVKEENDRMEAEQQEKRQFQLMKNGLGRIGLNRANIDYSKTVMHNPHFVFKNEEKQEVNALDRGEEEEKRQQELSLQKKKQQEENMKRSMQRGAKALEKMSREVEYNNYLKETEELQRQYNLKRIEQGKRNQYAGIKPLTLAQMEANKKLRGEQQFEQMFLSPNVDVYQAPASKYKIIQKKYENSQYHNELSSIDYKAESNQKVENIKKYAWQERQQDEQEEIQHRPIMVEPTPIFTKGMAETRLQEPKPPKQELSYSQSEDDSSYA